MRRRHASEVETATREPELAASVSSTFIDALFEPINPYSIKWFRRIFALAVIVDNVQMAQREEMSDYFSVAGRLHFAHEWPVPHPAPLPAHVMVYLPHAFVCSALAFGSGLLPRVGLAAYTVSWSFLNLCDASRYVNHFYLYGLLAALLLLASLDSNVRRVHLLLLRVQWSVAYFFAGCAKCSAEFLIRREPLRAYLQMGVASGMPLEPLAPLLTAEPTVAAAAIFALTFDLGAAFALWFQPTFKPFCALAAAFHLTNAMIFCTIGSFPFVSLASCLLFTEATPLAKPMERPQRKGEQCKAGSGKAGSGKADRSNGHRIGDNKSRQSILAAIFVWCAVQVLLPLRHHLLSDDVAWTKLGNEFAWRMMADTTDGWVDLTLTLHPTNRSFRLHPQSLPPAPVTLTSHSIRQLLASPGNLQQYVVAERDAAAKALLGGALGSEASAERNRFRPGGANNHGRGGRRLSVHAECWKSVNGRPYQRYCDPTFDFGGQDGLDAPLSLWSMSPRWMLPRLLGPWGAPSEADVAADAAANEWRARGYTAEAFVDAPGRPPWRDTILHSSGYREARVLCTHGRLAMRPAAPLGAAGDPRQLDAGARAEWTRLSVGESAQLRIGTAHELRNDDALPASWIYAMR